MRAPAEAPSLACSPNHLTGSQSLPNRLPSHPPSGSAPRPARIHRAAPDLQLLSSPIHRAAPDLQLLPSPIRRPRPSAASARSAAFPSPIHRAAPGLQVSVIIAGGIQFTLSDWQGEQVMTAEQIANPPQGRWVDGRGNDAIMYRGLPCVLI